MYLKINDKVFVKLHTKIKIMQSTKSINFLKVDSFLLVTNSEEDGWGGGEVEDKTIL